MKSILLFILFTPLCLKSQELLLVLSDDSSNLIHSRSYKDSTTLLTDLNKRISNIVSYGFLELKEMNRYWKNDSLFVTVKKNKRYRFNELTPDSASIKILTALSINKIDFNTSINNSFNAILRELENKGYPFASIKLKNIELTNDYINAKIHIEKNDLFFIDSIVIKGKTKTNKHIIYRLINILPGSLYNEQKLKNITKNINQSPILSQIRSSEVIFSNGGKAMLVLYLNDKNSNQFDGIVGINPDESNGNITITGSINIELNNALHQAEKIKLTWSKTQVQTQNFLIDINTPFLFKSPFGLTGYLSSFRQDTSFSKLSSKAGISYTPSFNQSFSVYVLNQNETNLLAPTSTTTLPFQNSTKTRYVGLSYTTHKLDDIRNPRHGYSVLFASEIGSKRITKNSDIMSSEYQQIEEQNNQYQLNINASYYIPVFNRSTILIKAISKHLISPVIFENELYQLGGLKTIRGFNEQALNASSFSIGTLEYRFLFDKSSALFIFGDVGYLESNTSNYTSNNPYGFGAGVNLGTKSGFFTLSYALGSQQNNPILIRNGKIHFGYISIF